MSFYSILNLDPNLFSLITVFLWQGLITCWATSKSCLLRKRRLFGKDFSRACLYHFDISLPPAVETFSFYNSDARHNFFFYFTYSWKLQRVSIQLLHVHHIPNGVMSAAGNMFPLTHMFSPASKLFESALRKFTLMSSSITTMMHP